jgi:Sulfotransferase family
MRNKAPVFVVGCPRSGTTLLYNMLLSAGGFAVYLAESNVFNLLGPRFGNPAVRSNRERLVESWLESKLFRASFLNAASLREKLMQDCNSSGDFLGIVMEEMCKAQNVQRWADNSPEELMHMARIKKEIPGALFIHMIRDGRDVSLSLDARPFPWVRPFSWDRGKSLVIAGVFWEWIVNRGREKGHQLRNDYLEIHFEELQARPKETLAKIGDFIEHDLDHDRIQRVGIGSVSDPNTSFKGDRTAPVGRWKERMTPENLVLFEAAVGATLTRIGYPLGVAENASAPDRFEAARLRAFYRMYLDAKFWFKNSALGRYYLGPLTGEGIDNIVIAVDPAQRPAAPILSAP